MFSVSQGCSVLTEIDLTRWDFQYKITDSSLLALSERCQLLQVAKFTGCDIISDVGISWLTSGCPAIQHLDLYKCVRITDIGMRAISEVLNHLKYLRLTGCIRVTDMGLRHIALGCQELETIHLDAVVHASDGTEFGERASEGVPSLAMRCLKIKDLNLASCYRVGDISLNELAVHGHRLTSLNLSRCPRPTPTALNSLIKASPTLRHLYLNETGGVTDLLLRSLAKFCKDLSTLHLSNCRRLTNSGIATVSVGCTQITDLDISGCNHIGDHGILAIAEVNRYPELRYLNLARLPNLTETGVSWLSERCTSILKLTLTGCSIRRSSMLAIKDAWKYATFRSDDSFMGMYPKYRALDRLVIDEYGACWKAATMIQSLYRAKIARRLMNARREESLMEWVATTLQRVYRGRKARRYAYVQKMLRQNEREAATTIQRWFIGLRNARLDAERRQKEYEDKLLECAIRVQCAWRQKKARGSALARKLERLAYEKKLNDCAMKLQRIWRGKQGRQHYSVALAAKIAKEKEEQAAASRIQLIYRGRAARKDLAGKRDERRKERARQERAALRIQSCIRGYRARKLYLQKSSREKQLTKSALMIQRRWRKRKQMLAFQLIRMVRRNKQEDGAARLLQSAWRRKQGYFAAHLLKVARTKDFYERDAAARKLQLIWRGRKGRDAAEIARKEGLMKLMLQTKIENDAAMCVQARWKGNKARRRYARMVLDRKQRWKEVEDKEKGTTIFYVSISAVVLSRKC